MRRILAAAPVTLLICFAWRSDALAQSCTYSVAPAAVSSAAQGKSGLIAVTTDEPTCTWAASSNQSWVSVAPVTGAYAQAVLADQPVGYWRLNESSGAVAADASGHGHPASYVGTVTLGEPNGLADGSTSAAFNFAGRVQVADGPVWNPATLGWNTATSTVEMWVNVALDVGNYQTVFAKGASPVSPITVYILPYTSEPLVYWRGTDGQNRFKMLNTGIVGQGWTHIVLTFTPTSYGFYINGALDSSGSLPAPLVANNEPITIADGDDAPLRGQMSDVAIYGTALNAQRVAAHYAERTTAGGAGSGHISYLIAPNPTTSARSATIAVGGESIAITEAALPVCAESVTPATIGSPAAGKSGLIEVGASDPTCQWAATSDQSWTRLVPVTGQYAGAILGDSPLGYWRLNEASGASVADDVSGNGRNGAYLGTVSLGVPNGLSDSSTAAEFAGSGQVRIPHDAAWNTSTLSIEAWINVPIMPGGYQTILTKGAWPDSPVTVYLLPATAEPQVLWRGTDGQNRFTVLNTAVVGHGWTHVVLAFTTSAYEFFVNGVLDSSGALPAPLVANTDALTLATGDDVWLRGQLSDVAIYGAALTAQQVAAHYALRTSIGNAGPGKVSYTVAANATTSARNAALTIGDQTVSVSQQGAVLPTVTISLTSPFQGTTFNSPSAIPLAASTSVTSGTITKVDFFAGSTFIGTTTSAPYQTNWTSVANGNYSLTAVATDNTGQITTSAAVAISVAEGSGSGTLGTPIASSPPGLYGPSLSIVLSAGVGSMIRYTTDSSTPSETSSAYTSPILVSQTTTLKARAFENGWTPSDMLSHTYVIDATGPTIIATYIPAPLASGWNNTPVTVSFACTDNLAGILACPEPLVFETEGAAQSATVTGTDTVGNQTSLTVPISIDYTPAAVSIETPSEGLTTSDSTVTIESEVSDTLSGLASATCNGVNATIVQGTVACTIDLRKGVNIAIVHVSDNAGNNVSKSVRMNRVGLAGGIVIAPAKVSLIAGNTLSLKALDDFGQPMASINWTSLDPAVGTVAADGTIAAVASGETTIRASTGALSADALLTVLAPEASLAGTVRWAVTALPESHVRELVAAGRFGATSTSFLDIEGADDESGIAIRGLNSAGEQTYIANAPLAPGEEVYMTIGDVNGGAIFLTGPANFLSASLLRVAPPGAKGSSWRYTIGGPYPDIFSPAQGSDGSVFALQGTATAEPAIVVLDGLTGQRKAYIPVPRNIYHYQFPDCPERNYSALGAPAVPGFILQTRPIVIDRNGTANVPLLRREATFVCQCDEAGSTLSNPQNTETVSLYRVNPNGTFTSLLIGTENVPPFQELYPGSVAIRADDIGGVSVYWEDADLNVRARHVTSAGGLGILYSGHPPNVTTTGQLGYVADGFTDINVVDMASGAIVATIPNPTGDELTAALTGGHVAVSNYFERITTILGPDGEVVATNLPGYVPAAIVADTWIGRANANEVAAVVFDAPIALETAAGSPVIGGNAANAGAPPAIYANGADEAAILALDFVWPVTLRTTREMGGRICHDSRGYRAGPPVVGNTNYVDWSKSPLTDLNVEGCAPYGVTVGYYHTHPVANIPAIDAANSVPSGYASQMEYNRSIGSDLKLADYYPTYAWYLLAPNPSTTPTHFLWYQAPNSKAHIFEFDFVNNVWRAFPIAPW